MSLFDLIKPQTDNTEECLKETIMHGTGFDNGKKRVYELYQKSMSPSDRANAIKKEYGLSGAG
jgi:sialic acid synthase SpsE